MLGYWPVKQKSQAAAAAAAVVTAVA